MSSFPLLSWGQASLAHQSNSIEEDNDDDNEADDEEGSEAVAGDVRFQAATKAAPSHLPPAADPVVPFSSAEGFAIVELSGKTREEEAKWPTAMS